MNDQQLLAWEILRTPDDINFVDYRMTRNKTWLTRDRKIVLIKDMKTSHISNCIAMLERADQTHTMMYFGLLQELEQRQVSTDEIK